MRQRLLGNPEVCWWGLHPRGCKPIQNEPLTQISQDFDDDYFLICLVISKFCTEHNSAMLCAKFQNDWSTDTGISWINEISHDQILWWILYNISHIVPPQLAVNKGWSYPPSMIRASGGATLDIVIEGVDKKCLKEKKISIELFNKN